MIVLAGIACVLILGQAWIVAVECSKPKQPYNRTAKQWEVVAKREYELNQRKLKTSSKP